MIGFHEFLSSRLEAGGFSTEDTLASFLPLVRETLEAHAAGRVAPLDGIDQLRVEGVRIWFEEAKRKPPRENVAALRKIESATRAPVEIVSERSRTTDVDEGNQSVVDFTIGNRDEPITRPVYLPGYVSWEQAVEHHDPLTDVFCLGMILAGLACGLDFTDAGDLQKLVAHRRNLFKLNDKIHPVVAQAITRMTELDRHRRTQNLAALLFSLENYREQDVDFEIDLARIEGFETKDLRTKQQLILAKLQERLFEISRRNRLLHFRATMHTVNLTHSSVPLSFDIRNIRPDQIMVWNEELQQAIVRGKPFSLNKHLNFAEALYLPSTLDRILADSRRDLAEFGFVQLRLVVCFLHWANLKETPAETFQSPLVLLPVRLIKKKGIRDTYLLEPLSSDAEVNPVLRHQFKQLYGIDLPETIDLTRSNLDTFYDYLKTKIAQSEPAVVLNKIDRPRIDLIHEKARRKLDQYRRRARIAGRGVRTYLDLDYSYDPANYHPLGIKLFAAKIRPPSTRLREIIEERPRPRSYAAPAETPTVEKERTFYQLRDGADENPYSWSFDLCSLTLANFKYRKMSLVRDYEELLANGAQNAAFEATFSLAPRPVSDEPLRSVALDDRFDVLPCDPTQSAAIAEARAGTSYIIQGPPGTGKSQTIANLIADYVARGQRVLFVCEKRAAIDVVYHRLRERGLAELCCLIHDSQTDKKAFVMDLKATYEAFLSESSKRARKTNEDRGKVLADMRNELRPLEQFNAAMLRVPENAGISLRELIERCIELSDHRPTLSPLEQERLPNYALWVQHRDRLTRFAARLEEIQNDGVLANHSLSMLSPHLAELDRPLDLISTTVQTALDLLRDVTRVISQSRIAAEAWETLNRARMLLDYAQQVAPLASLNRMSLLDATTNDAREFDEAAKQLRERQQVVASARNETKAWREKLSAADVQAALGQARLLERAFMPWFRPSWWRLRGILNRAYDFRSHVIRPTWTNVLETLEKEYGAVEQLQKARNDLAQQYRFELDVDKMIARIDRLRESLTKMSQWLAHVHATLSTDEHAAETVETILTAERPVTEIVEQLGKILDDFQERPLEPLRRDLSNIQNSLDQLPDFLQCIAEITPLPQSLKSALRTMPLTVAQLEAAVAERTLEDVYRADRSLARFDETERQQHVARLDELYQAWQRSNAREVRERVKERFLENVRMAGLPASQLGEEQKEFKKRYNRGRRELEHEFGKSMRYKSIRDLVADETGDVIKDLKPVWLMSPLSVSDTLPLDTDHFDVVIFDEASQITLEESISPLFRARQAIVVGDEMQLPPTDFFSAKRSEEEEELLLEEDGDVVHYDLDTNSFLNHAAKNLPSTMLGWHYRSRNETLISFSNWAFYQGRLLTVPEEELPRPQLAPLVAKSPAEGDANADQVLDRPISFHFMDGGVYDKRRNRAEADYIAHLVRGLLTRHQGKSVGIVAFSEAQQDEIEGALERLSQQDAQFRDLLEAEYEREEDGQFVGLILKNLENIQGDERDVMIMSICYGYAPNGKMLMNFGPINKSGGEKRLNVAFTRAKHHMAVISSIHSTDITNEYNDGANCLKNYLRYAEAVSVGQRDTAELVLNSLSHWRGDDRADRDEPDDALSRQLAAALAEHGYQVDYAVGQSHFRCNLALRRDDDPAYRLGILIDNDTHYKQPDLVERELMRPKLLRAFGWNVAHVLAKEWRDDREGSLQRLLNLLGGQDSRSG